MFLFHVKKSVKNESTWILGYTPRHMMLKLFTQCHLQKSLISKNKGEVGFTLHTYWFHRDLHNIKKDPTNKCAKYKHTSRDQV